MLNILWNQSRYGINCAGMLLFLPTVCLCRILSLHCCTLTPGGVQKRSFSERCNLASCNLRCPTERLETGWGALCMWRMEGWDGRSGDSLIQTECFNNPFVLQDFPNNSQTLEVVKQRERGAMKSASYQSSFTQAVLQFLCVSLLMPVERCFQSRVSLCSFLLYNHVKIGACLGRHWTRPSSSSLASLLRAGNSISAESKEKWDLDHSSICTILCLLILLCEPDFSVVVFFYVTAAWKFSTKTLLKGQNNRNRRTWTKSLCVCVPAAEIHPEHCYTTAGSTFTRLGPSSTLTYICSCCGIQRFGLGIEHQHLFGIIKCVCGSEDQKVSRTWSWHWGGFLLYIRCLPVLADFVQAILYVTACF